MTRSVHLVGSIPLHDAKEVFTTVARTLDTSVKRIPDGETGERSNWIAWQLPLLHANNDMEADPELTKPSHETAEDGLAVDEQSFRFLRVKPGVTADALTLETDYAKHAIESYEVFAGLQESGDIPESVRFQVSLPTPYAVASLYVSQSSWDQFLPAYTRALIQELGIITSRIPNDRLAIQWDVCMEVMAWENQLPPPEADLQGFTFRSIGALCDAVPDECDVGIHLCYGDPGHKHIVEPRDMRILVEIANGICAAASRPVNWMHMPVPKERDDAAYFAPLTELRLNDECELYLGLVHFTDRDEGAARRIAAAGEFATGFGIATECGFGRRPVETVLPLLELHRRCSQSN